MNKKVAAVVIIILNFLLLNPKYVKAKDIDSSIVSLKDAFISLNNNLKPYLNEYQEDLTFTMEKEHYDYLLKHDLKSDYNYITNYLISKNKTENVQSLNNLKNISKENLIIIKENLIYIENYLQEHKSLEVAGNIGIFVNLRNLVLDLKTELLSTLDIFDDTFIDAIIKNIDEQSEDDLISFTALANDYLNQTDGIIGKFNTYFAKYQNLYNDYYLKDYEDILQSDLKDVTAKIDSYYNKVYDYIISKLETSLQNEINNIINNNKDITTRNSKLLNLINVKTENKNKLNNNFNLIKDKIKVSLLLDNIKYLQQEIIDCYSKQITKIESYLINGYQIKVKDAYTSSTKINESKKYLVLNNHLETSSLTINKINITNANLSITNIYNGYVGTKSLLNVQNGSSILEKYVIIVKGDVYADGKITALDYVRVKNHIMNSNVIKDDILWQAADYNSDNKITSLDYVKIKNIILKGGK